MVWAVRGVAGEWCRGVQEWKGVRGAAMATQPHAGVAVATASAVCVGVDAAASTSGRRVVVGGGSGRKGVQSLASRRSIVPARFVAGGKDGERRQRGIAVRAKDGSSFAKGTQFFKLGGRKGEADEEEKEAAPSGTQFFKGLGGWGKKAREDVEEDDEPNEKPGFFGTQRIKFGTKRDSADSGNGAAATGKGGALVRKESTALDALPFGRGRRSDPRTVFVAGATGQIGARISQQLLHSGFNVRGGVRELYFAQQLAEFATQYGVRSLTTYAFSPAG